MHTTAHGVSSCRHCQFYKMEGRRGGFCHQLGVSVQGRWRSCPFAAPLFAARLESETSVIVCLQDVLELETLAADSFMPLEEQADSLPDFAASNTHPA